MTGSETSAPILTDAKTGLARFIDIFSGLATSWVGLLTAYLTACTAAIVGFEAVNTRLSRFPLWLRLTLLAGLPVTAVIFQAVPAVVEQRRRKRLSELGGELKPGYFQLSPLEDESTFTRADKKHEEVLRWLRQRTSRVLYLSGQSGSGKSSLLTASVLPQMERDDTIVIRLRGYQDPVALLEDELRKPGIIWQRSPSEATDVFTLLERAARHVRPRRLLVVLDQFEEFVILQDTNLYNRFEQLVNRLTQQADADITLLLVFRTDYIGLIETLSLPPLIQQANWLEVPPFTEGAARDFLRRSGLQIRDDILQDVLREAAEIENTTGLIRPITVNLCGLILGRFAGGLPKSFRPGKLIRGFLSESIFLPSIRDLTPRIIPHLITNYVTKRPRTIAELAEASGFSAGDVRGYLRVLGQSDRAIVRPLDHTQQTWEISHDFLVPLLDSIVAHWTASVWKRVRPWLPWIAATTLVIAVAVVSNWRQDPIPSLRALGWTVTQKKDSISLAYGGTPPKESNEPLRRMTVPFNVRLGGIQDLEGTVLALHGIRNLYGLDLERNNLTDLSPLSRLEYLSALDFSLDPDITDIKPLSKLKRLTFLNLFDAHVSDLSPLSGLTGLTTLILGSTAVKDISPLRHLSLLSQLDLSRTQTSDLSALEGLTRLTKLQLGHLNVSDISSLKNLTNLRDLDLSGTKVADITPLGGLKGLETLDLSNTQIADLSPLTELNKLDTLNVYSAKVSDLSPIKTLTRLRVLEISNNHIRDLSALKNMMKLERLTAMYNPVRDISPLKGLTALYSLDLRGTSVRDVSPLADLTALSRS